MRSLLLFPIFIAFITFSHAQKTHGGYPIVLSQNSMKGELEKGSFIKEIQSLDQNEINAFDENTNGIQRFAAPVKVNLNLENAGQWTQLDGGGRVWTLHLRAKEAKGLVVSYDHFSIPRGGRFFMYSPDGKQIEGAYTMANNKASGTFLTGMISGEEAVLEYYEPADQIGKGSISLSRIYQIYKPEEAFANKYPFKAKSTVMDTGFGASNVCNINVNCELGDDYQDEKRGVVRIMMVLEEGLGWCSGSLMNNTAEDARLYILTAFHCQDGYTPLYDMWRFDFKYEAEGCDNPDDEPGYESFLGCEFRSGFQASDFLLLEMEDEELPASTEAYFNGWNHDDEYEPPMGTIIHHPAGDIKKISHDEDMVTIFPFDIDWNTGVTTPPFFHFRSIIDEGVMEGGSSGCPLFDPNGHVVGQLNGGVSDCNVTVIYCGRIAKSWDETGDSTTRLKDWLDPLNLQLTSWDGMENPTPEIVTISGFVKTHVGEGMGNVMVSLSGPDVDQVIFTDTAGYYEFTDVPIGENYIVVAEKNVNAANGVSALDLLKIQKHVLGKELLTEPHHLDAADANDNGSISGIDLVQVQKVNLGIEDGFPNRPSWEFHPTIIEVNDVFNDAMLMDILGTKIGDVNDSADPDE